MIISKDEGKAFDKIYDKIYDTNLKLIGYIRIQFEGSLPSTIKKIYEKSIASIILKLEEFPLKCRTRNECPLFP